MLTLIDSYKSLDNKYDGEVDDEFDYEIKEYRKRKAKR